MPVFSVPYKVVGLDAYGVSANELIEMLNLIFESRYSSYFRLEFNGNCHSSVPENYKAEYSCTVAFRDEGYWFSSRPHSGSCYNFFVIGIDASDNAAIIMCTTDNEYTTYNSLITNTQRIDEVISDAKKRRSNIEFSKDTGDHYTKTPCKHCNSTYAPMVSYHWDNPNILSSTFCEDCGSVCFNSPSGDYLILEQSIEWNEDMAIAMATNYFSGLEKPKEAKIEVSRNSDYDELADAVHQEDSFEPYVRSLVGLSADDLDGVLSEFFRSTRDIPWYEREEFESRVLSLVANNYMCAWDGISAHEIMKTIHRLLKGCDRKYFAYHSSVPSEYRKDYCYRTTETSLDNLYDFDIIGIDNSGNALISMCVDSSWHNETFPSKLVFVSKTQRVNEIISDMDKSREVTTFPCKHCGSDLFQPITHYYWHTPLFLSSSTCYRCCYASFNLPNGDCRLVPAEFGCTGKVMGPKTEFRTIVSHLSEHEELCYTRGDYVWCEDEDNEPF
jgi:hypothetical protein